MDFLVLPEWREVRSRLQERLSFRLGGRADDEVWILGALSKGVQSTPGLREMLSVSRKGLAESIFVNLVSS